MLAAAQRQSVATGSCSRLLVSVRRYSVLGGTTGDLVARISWAERLGLGSVEDHSPFGERDFADRRSRWLSPQASTGGKSA